MKNIFLAIAFALLAFPALSAIPNTAIWEVESGGSDTNGGGFISGASGTDFSQQTAAHVTFNGTTISATAAGVSSTIVISGYTVATTDVGNMVQITGGTGFTTGIYQIVSVSVGSVTWTLDRNATTGAATGMAGKMGGAFATVAQGLAQLIADQALYVKSASYTITAALTPPAGITGGTFNTQMIGYTTSRGDGGRPTISQTSAVNIMTVSGIQSLSVSNFIFDGTGTALVCLSDSGFFNKYINTTWKNCTTGGVSFTNGGTESKLILSEVTGITGGTYAVVAQGEGGIFYSYIHDNSVTGCSIGNGGSSGFVGNIVANNTGDGCDVSYDTEIFGNLFYGNTGDGAKYTGNQIALTNIIANNIYAKNGGFGINSVAGGGVGSAIPGIFNNGFWNNTSGAVNNFNLPGSSNVLITGSGTTNDPFVSDSTKNWALNGTAGAGALLRNVGFAGAYTGLSTSTGYQDIGPFRHQDSGGGGGTGGAYPFGG